MPLVKFRDRGGYIEANSQKRSRLSSFLLFVKTTWKLVVSSLIFLLIVVRIAYQMITHGYGDLFAFIAIIFGVIATICALYVRNLFKPDSNHTEEINF